MVALHVPYSEEICNIYLHLKIGCFGRDTLQIWCSLPVCIYVFLYVYINVYVVAIYVWDITNIVLSCALLDGGQIVGFVCLWVGEFCFNC